ncbi:hypothetical protein [Amycolatopsis sp. lyj-23]|uniref:hypothetical protein n=1 Tax=Amycolatopsis sp. lyj-23 TaxID=2789283 RepID=UPI0039791C9F
MTGPVTAGVVAGAAGVVVAGSVVGRGVRGRRGVPDGTATGAAAASAVVGVDR